MIIVQKFHSIHEIDTEFIPNIEALLQEEVASFDILVHRHDKAPSSDVFTYFLFFGPTQNAPIGLAQLCLRKIPSASYLPWYKKMKFWDKEHEHWKQLTWQIGEGCSGMCVFDPRFARLGKEKLIEIIAEYEARPDVMAQNFYYLKGLQDFPTTWTDHAQFSKESYVLDPLAKASKSYEDYILTLRPEIQKEIKKAWRHLYSEGKIELGDYKNPAEIPETPAISGDQLENWKRWGAQVLTFEKDQIVLGCLLVLKGKNGNVFFEPFPFEPEGQALVSDELYTQYALIKFFEMPEARKCHMMKFGTKLIFDNKDDLEFFKDQGFQTKTVTQSFFSRLQGLTHPL